MRRLALRVVSVLALLVCLAAAALWVRSYRISDMLGHWSEQLQGREERREWFSFVAHDGRVQMSAGSYRQTWLTDGDLQLAQGNMTRRVLPLGFYWQDARQVKNMSRWPIWPGGRGIDADLVWQSGPWFRHRRLDITLPLWLVCLFSLMCSTAGLGMHRRLTVLHRRRVGGLCLRCGYDLRATPECCPECGARAIGPPSRPPHNPPMQRTVPAV